MTSCRNKNHWAHASDAMRAARRYEMKHGYVFEWYLCDCQRYHLRTRMHEGQQVLSLDAIRQSREQ